MLLIQWKVTFFPFPFLFLLCCFWFVDRRRLFSCQSPHTELISDEFTKNMPDTLHLWSDSVGVWSNMKNKQRNKPNIQHEWRDVNNHSDVYTHELCNILFLLQCATAAERGATLHLRFGLPDPPHTRSRSLLWFCFHSVRLLSRKFTLSATGVVSETILFFSPHTFR